MGDGGAEGRSQTQTDRHEVVGKNKAGGVGRRKVDDRPAHGVAAVDHYGPVAWQHRIEFEHQRAWIDRAAVALILEIVEPKGIDLPSDLLRAKARGAEAALGQLLGSELWRFPLRRLPSQNQPP